MTVKELKELLEEYEDSDEIRLQYQGDGGLYSGDGEITDIYAKLNREGKRYVLLY